MDRRGFLALLAPLTAGCFGGATVSRREEMPPATETPDATANGQDGSRSTATRTPEPTDTPEQTPSPSEQKAERRLETARERVREVVEEYADSGDLADVRADEDEFVPSDVYVALVRASGAVNEFSALAATDEQEATAEALVGVVSFLSRATAGQAAAVAGHDALLAVRDDLDAGSVESAESSVDALGEHRDDVERAVAHVESESDDADLEATDALADDARSTKLDQFEAAETALDDVADPVRTLVDGADLLGSAREEADDGNDEYAADLASDAADAFAEVYDDLDELAGDLPREAGPFEDAIETLAEFASDGEHAADDLVDEYDDSTDDSSDDSTDDSTDGLL
jgi:hypothetical protein